MNLIKGRVASPVGSSVAVSVITGPYYDVGRASSKVSERVHQVADL